MNETLLISGMFAVTFGVRYILFAVASKVRFPPWLNKGLEFVPPVVLMAIIAPSVTMPKGDLWLAYNNPWLLAAIIAVITALVRKDILTTIVGGMMAFGVLRFGFNL